MPAPRVVIVTHTAELGGAELAMLRLIEALPEGEFDIHVVTWSDGDLVTRLRASRTPVSVLDAGVVATVTRAQSGRMGAVRRVPDAMSVARRLRTLLRELDADLVVANSLKAAVVVSVAARSARRPWVWHLHDRLAADYLPAPVARAMRMLAARSPRRIVANSHATLATLPERGRERAVVAYPGVSPDLASRPREVPAAHTVGLVGRIAPTKGQLEFIEAMDMVRSRHATARGVIIGAAMFTDGDYEARVRAAAGTSIALHGWTDDPVAAVSSLTIVVHASPVPEPFGQVVAEAVCLGVPVVATDAGGVPEILAAGDGSASQHETVGGSPLATQVGTLVPPGDVPALAQAISDLLDDPSRWSVAPAARARAARALSIAETARVVAPVWRETALSRRRTR